MFCVVPCAIGCVSTPPSTTNYMTKPLIVGLKSYCLFVLFFSRVFENSFWHNDMSITQILWEFPTEPISLRRFGEILNYPDEF